MPLRKWMTEHGHPGWYSWFVIIGGCLTSMLIAVVISVQASNRAIAESEMRQRQADERGRATVCEFVNKIDGTYRDEPPSLPSGKAQAAAWAELRQDFQCNGGK